MSPPAPGHRGRLLMVVNDAEFFLSHRLPIAQAAREAGWEVHLATNPSAGVADILAEGFTHHVIHIDRGGVRPDRDLATLWALYRLFQRLRPHLLHTVTIKPVIWGGIAARMARLPARLAAVPGVGYIYIAEGGRGRVLRTVAARLYRMALSGGNHRILFQNPFDRELLRGFGVAVDGRSEVIRGSGVRLEEFPFTPEPPGPPVVLMSSRMLRYKGPAEFVEAARILHRQGVAAQFKFAGEPDPGNPDSVHHDQLEKWKAEGVVEFLGHRSDMPAVLASSHIVVLPSRTEGVPKALIEAAAIGRAVVTCDAPGSRDAIEPGRTGLLVPVGDPPALAKAIVRLIKDPGERQRMGAAGRRLAEREFDIEHIVRAHLNIYNRLQSPPR